VGQLLDTVADIKRLTNRDLRVLRVLSTLYDSRTLHAREVLDDINDRYGLAVQPPISRSVPFAEAPAAGRSVLSTARGCVVRWPTASSMGSAMPASFRGEDGDKS